MFNGSIPASLGNLPEKVYIDLTYNNLSGPIPQNGALMNRGPTAFIGNPGLCGPPLKNLCSSDNMNQNRNPPSSLPYLPNPPQENIGKVGGGRGLSKVTIAAIVVSDVVGIFLIGLLFSYCYSRFSCFRKRNKDYTEKRETSRKQCLCFMKDESESLSENAEQYDLVHLDAEVAFDLDELLKASAFVLGKTGIGIVYRVVLEDGLTLAVRRLGEGGSQRFKEFQTEVEAIAKLRHPNLVTLRAYYWSVDEKLLIYEFLPNGNLSVAIHGKQGHFYPISWSMRLKIMKGVAKGLVYLHEFSPKKYVHGDLKPSNILLNHNFDAKISDFGLGHLAHLAGGMVMSKHHQRQHSSVASEVVPTVASASLSTYYQAPEALKVMKPSQKWDVYSYGMVLLEVVTGRGPLVQDGSLEMSLVKWLQKCIEEKQPLSTMLDSCLVQEGDKEEEMIGVLKIAMTCTHSSPDRRPSMKHVLEALESLPLSHD